LRGYLTVLGVYGGLCGGTALLAKKLGRTPPEFGLADTVRLSVATHKLSRLLSKDAVTSPLRAPFARYESQAGDAEVMESPRGTGAQHAAGELLTCPFCLAVWIASGLTAGFVFAPRVARTVCTGLTAVAVSDTLQLIYDAAKKGAEKAGT